MKDKDNKMTRSSNRNNKSKFEKWRETRRKKKESFQNKRMARPPVKRYIYDTGRYLKNILLALLVILVVTASSALYIYKSNYEEMVSSSIRKGYEVAEDISPEDFKVIEPTSMYYDDGSLARTFTERNFTYLDLQEDDELFQKVSDVTTSIEDERFYKHKGFDYLGVGVAVFDYIKGGSLRGASTLTAQLVKNTYLTQEQNVERKITEAVIAQELEKKFTKREILEFYLNDAYFANGNYGLATASNYYYSRPVKDLSYEEIASLVAIPNNPTIYNPVENPENNKKRRDLILRLMKDNEVITEDYLSEATEKPIELDITVNRIDNNIYDWAESFAMHSAVEELMRYNGFSFQYWFNDKDSRTSYQERYNEVYYQTLQRVMRGGYKLETSINKEKQESLQKHVDRTMSQYTKKDKNGYLSKQAPAVVVDNRTNEVVAIVGGRSQENAGLFNRAYQSARQPGSAMKPFLSYATAFEKGLGTGTIRKDERIKNGPGNWYNGYRGNMSLRTALEQSVNTIAYNLYQEVGMENARNKLVEMEFNHLSPDDIYPTMAIGGWTHGTNPLEVTRAFNTMVNDGVYHRPHNIRKLSQIGSDNEIYSRDEHEGKRVYQSGVGYITLDVMQSTVRDSFVKGYSFGYKHEAAKTGTTNSSKEMWIVGGTPYYSMSAYIGDNNPTAQTGRSITPLLQKLYTGYMKEIHEGLEEINFNRPQSVVQQGNNLWVRTSKDIDPLKKRKLKEEERLQEFVNMHKTRIDKLAYRIEHGLTLKQVKSREKLAEAKIQQLESYSLNGSKDMARADNMRESALEALDRIVRPDVKNGLSKRLSTAYANIQQERARIIEDEERIQRLEKERELEKERQKQVEINRQEELERKEQERIEQERLEQERLEEEEENRKIHLEQERLEQERLEQERIEKENQEKEEQDQVVDDNTDNDKDNSVDDTENDSERTE